MRKRRSSSLLQGTKEYTAVAQWTRAVGFYPIGREFESLQPCQVSKLDVGIEKSNESLVADAGEPALVYREHK